MEDMVVNLWRARAKQQALVQAHDRVGANIWSEAKRLVPCSGTGRRAINFPIYAFDVRAVGNCLYHAVWLAAEISGLRIPFGFKASDHVFNLRLHVAVKLRRLLEEGLVFNDTNEPILSICDQVAMPNQYLKHSGLKPLMAMALLLKQTIVVLSCDGLMEVVPFDSSLIDADKVVAIYHCSAIDMTSVTPFRERNHYVAVEPNDEMLNVIRNFRETSMENLYYDDDKMNGVIHLAQQSANNNKKRKRKLNDVSSESYMKCAQDTDLMKPSLQLLMDRALDLKSITDEELELLRRNQNYTKDPKLGLLYYHCCSSHPNVHVANDESLMEKNSNATERLLTTLENPIQAKVISGIQRDVVSKCGSSGDIWTCASCCELMNTVDDRVHTTSMTQLHSNFVYTLKEFERLVKVPDDIKMHYQYFEINGVYYHLNPELVYDTNRIVLCDVCVKDPREHPYSIANSHDYGRYINLPTLNDVALGCISPVRHFGLELSISGKHSIGHSICFPSDGPDRCTKVIPQISRDNIPRVTFVGPLEKWRIERQKYRNLYRFPIENMYQWMHLLVHTHSYYKEHNITINESEQMKRDLVQMQDVIESNVLVTDFDEIVQVDDKIIQERYATDYITKESDPMVKRSAILKSTRSPIAECNGAIEAMLNIIQTAHEVTDSTVLPIQRESNPICEWFNNGDMIGATFPHLFMHGGHCLPDGTWPTKFIDHLMKYYDGRFEGNTMFVATLFNQLQRHTAVQKSASIASSRTQVLQELGKLANSSEFREKLANAKANPHTSESKRLNASLNRVVSLVGGCVPFSPFERASTRPKLAALRYRYGIPLHWVTVAPPEHDDVELHRIAMIQRKKTWNDPSSLYTHSTCSFKDFDANITEDSRSRLKIAAQHPALSANVFRRRMHAVCNYVISCKESKHTRVSHDYSMRQNRAYGMVAAYAGIIEPQRDGRLHQHMTIYGSTYSPQVLTRIACSDELSRKASDWLTSICRTEIDEDVHNWHNELVENKQPMPRAYQIEVPLAEEDYEKFCKSSQRRIALTNFHEHSTTCKKGRRGKYLCRLARPAGIHEEKTAPIIITRLQRGNLTKRMKPSLTWSYLSDTIRRTIDEGYKIHQGFFFREKTTGPILWELHRSLGNALLVETNTVLASTTLSHTNSAIINGEDAGDMVEEYQEQYMTKNDVALKGAATALLSAINHMQNHPSTADNQHTHLRQGQFLATRTVNTFSGSHEWSHSLMVYAITGNRSFTSSHSFWYVFPYSYMTFIKENSAEDDYDIEDDDHLETLQKLENTVNSEDNTQRQNPTSDLGGGVRIYTVNGKVLLLSQVQSYIHRGKHFECYSPLEFACIVDLKPVSTNIHSSQRGRPKRRSFKLAATHPLFASHEAFIRAKMHTAIFGGAPPPTWPREHNHENRNKRLQMAQYLMSTFTSWSYKISTSHFTDKQLAELFKKWDSYSASLINRQRLRYMRNLMQKGNRSSNNEEICTDWRNRNVDYWEDDTKQNKQHGDKNTNKHTTDPELTGSLKQNDLYELLTKISTTNPECEHNINALKQTFFSTIPDNFTRPNANLNTQATEDTIFKTKRNSITLQKMAMTIKNYNATMEEHEKRTHNGTLNDPLRCTIMESAETNQLSTEQKDILDSIVSKLDSEDRTSQSLTFVHGGGGTGKSFLVRAISNQIKQRNYEIVSTCPTGAGACQLNEGRTFHAALKCGYSQNLSSKSSNFLRQLFNNRVRLIVIDEVSMLQAEFLYLLDNRLRMLYDPAKPFGGRSILMTGDFLQLSVINGTSLCQLMYTKTLTQTLSTAKHLFNLFRVFKLQTQHRASECETQQQLLRKLRRLPPSFPKGNRWTKEDLMKYAPIDEEILSAITNELTINDVLHDKDWIMKSTILVTSNIDRTVLNASLAKIHSQQKNVLLIRWRKKLRDKNQEMLQKLLYNEDKNPELFAYFFKGAPAQILDNGNGNVSLGIANGTQCSYHSLGWKDEKTTSSMIKFITSAAEKHQSTITLPEPPDFINVELADRQGNALNGRKWPSQINLDESKNKVVIPIGIIASNAKHGIKIKGSDNTNINIHYEQHAVDIAMAMTVWKAQGSTFDRVILLLEGSKNAPSWKFEHIYVALSRVRSIQNIRCFPLSLLYKKNKLLLLRPNIFTTKWRMSIDTNGYFNQQK